MNRYAMVQFFREAEDVERVRHLALGDPLRFPDLFYELTRLTCELTRLRALERLLLLYHSDFLEREWELKMLTLEFPVERSDFRLWGDYSTRIRNGQARLIYAALCWTPRGQVEGSTEVYRTDFFQRGMMKPIEARGCGS
jgi:hypothetical protein